jgi:hypothetical protein
MNSTPILLTDAISRRTRYRRVALRHWSDTDIAAWTIVLALTALMFLTGCWKDKAAPVFAPSAYQECSPDKCVNMTIGDYHAHCGPCPKATMP